MKSVIIILVSIILFSCSNDGGKSKAISRRDTSYPFAVYLGYGLKGFQTGIVRKVTIHDTLIWVGKDSSTFKKELTDSVYYEVSAYIPVKDSTTAKLLGVKSTDTVVSRVLTAIPKYVRELKDYDNMIAELEKFRDTTLSKKDTTKIN